MIAATQRRQRDHLAIVAATEIESIARLMQRTFQGADPELVFVLGMAIRLEQLAAAVICIDNDDPLDEVLDTLFGPEARRSRIGGAQ